jgi:hypothetical protein
MFEDERVDGVLGAFDARVNAKDRNVLSSHVCAPLMW